MRSVTLIADEEKTFGILKEGLLPDKRWFMKIAGINLEISDGYHTMSELYEHRHALFTALINTLDSWITPLNIPKKCWKSRFDLNGNSLEDGWFLAGIVSETFSGKEQISYHLPMSWWGKVKCIELKRAPEWDGHTSKDVIERLAKL